MQVVAPNRIRIEATRQPDNTWNVIQRERFDPQDTEAFKNLVAFVKDNPRDGVRARFDSDESITISYKAVSRERAGNIICMEFLQWSTVGEMKLRDIIMSAFCGGANAPGEDLTTGRA